MRLLLFAIVLSATAASKGFAREVAFDGPITCTLESLGEKIVLEPFFKAPYLSTAQCDLGASCELYDGFEGDNSTPADRPDRRYHYQPHEALKLWKSEPKRSPVFATGFAPTGEPVTKFKVVVIESGSLSDLRIDNFPKYEALVGNSLTRPYFEYFIGMSPGGDAVEYSRDPDATFTARAMRDRGGSLTRRLPYVNPKTLRVVYDDVTCTGRAFKDVP